MSGELCVDGNSMCSIHGPSVFAPVPHCHAKLDLHVGHVVMRSGVAMTFLYCLSFTDKRLRMTNAAS